MANKRLILAVAGSGKTRLLIESLNLEERFLITTYTNTSLNLIRKRIINKFGFYPKNITTLTYFEFLYSICIKPFALFKYDLKGIFWEHPPMSTTYLKNSDSKKFLSKVGYLYHNRIGKFVEHAGILEDIHERLEKFYDHFFFDEFQDLGGHDFNFIMDVSQCNLNFLFVGDYFQNTYVTSYDGNVNSNLYSDFSEYCKKITSYNITLDFEMLGNSYRCTSTICNFISKNLDVAIKSMRDEESQIIDVNNKTLAMSLIWNKDVAKLVYDKSAERAYFCKNWGECKGEDDYVDTCIILNKTTSKLYDKGKLTELAPRTKNKLYVAISRTRGDCYFLKEELLQQFISEHESN